MTADSLHKFSAKDLAQLARKHGVEGWHSMRKDQLIRALARTSRRSGPPAAKASRHGSHAGNGAVKSHAGNGAVKSHAGNGAVKSHAGNGAVKSHAAAARRKSAAEPRRAKAKSARVAVKLEAARAKHTRSKDLAAKGRRANVARDRLVLMVRDPFWLHAYWELSRQGVERAQAAMGQEWHAARPILRLNEVSGGATTSSAEMHVRDIDIHGSVCNWYIDVQEPPRSFRVDVGYKAPSGRFFVLARSNIVTTPKADASDAIDENWTDVAENFEKIYAMSGGYAPEGPSQELQELFEERLRRPMGTPTVARYGPGASGLLGHKNEFSFAVDAELIVYGVTDPEAHVTLGGDPVRLRRDGTFTVRFSLPNCRQVIPAVASSRDGLEQRTVVLAVERNTKVMEPLTRDAND